jgi:peptidoglycan/xylan/chitin deacetylase (PgdA/CDA1 family)
LSILHSRPALALLAALAAAPALPATAQQLAITWDDLPAHGPLPPGETRVEIAQKIIAAMQQAKLPPAYGFVNGIQTQNEPASTPVLQLWRDAGLPLGNHTWSHMNLNTNPLADWEQDVTRNEAMLQKYMGDADWRWLRYPYLAEGDTAATRAAGRRFLADRGYKVATVTMGFGDYLYNEPYARCVAKKDSAAIARLESSYLAAADAAIVYSRSLSKALYGHDIPYVLLMHVGAFDARMLPRLLALYRERGFRFVTLEEAESAPFYRSAIDPGLPSSPDSLEAAMAARGLPLPPAPGPGLDLDALCR